jgi:hypothetical protein
LNAAQTYIFSKQGFNSRNVLSNFNDSELTNVREIKYPGSDVKNAQYKGFEDCRLIVWDDKLYAYGTRWDKINGNGCMCIYEINDEFEPVNEIVIKPQGTNNCEKNWGAIEDQPFTFVYSNNPTKIVKVDADGNLIQLSESTHNDVIKEWIKGSTQVIRYTDNEYMSIVHTNMYYNNGKTKHSDYVTAFIFYDNNFNVTRMSKWFVFNSPMCEFTCGLAKHGDDIYITYSQLDCTSHLIVTNKQAIESFIGLSGNDFNSDTFYDYYFLAKTYEENNQLNASYVLFNYAAQLADTSIFTVNDEMKIECLVKTYCGLVSFAPKILNENLYNDIVNSLKRVIERYPNVGEFYYLVSSMYKMCKDRKNEYVKYKKLGDERKTGLHNYFLKYFNPNYL